MLRITILVVALLVSTAVAKPQYNTYSEVDTIEYLPGGGYVEDDRVEQ